MRQSRTLASVAFFCVLGAACANDLHVEAVQEDGSEHDVAFVGQDDALLSQLTRDEEGYDVTPLLERAAAFNRVAYRFDADASLQTQARARRDGVMGPWIDATLTYQDESANNAHVDVGDGADAVQLRFKLQDEAGLTFLAVETFDYVPVVDEGGAVVDAVDEDDTQGLAADGIVVTRSQWGARSRSCGPRHTPQRLTIHHTVTPNNDSMSMPARLRQIQAFHIDSRGWCDIGYHFLIGQDGKVYQGRVENIVGAHAANANTNNVGISFIGDFTTKVPPDNMLNAGARIIKAMSRTYGIALNRDKIKGHRQVGTTETSCPGNQLYNRLQNLIDRARNSSGSGGGGSSTTSDFCGAARTGFWCSGSSVVECSNGNEVRRTRCESGCQVMPPGTPDRCTPDAPPPPPSLPPPSFSDVPRDHWAFAAVEALKARGAVSGCGNGRFCPDAKLTRQGAAKIMAVLEAGNVDVSGVPNFSDTSGDVRSWAKEVVARGIMEGCEGGAKFCPNGPVSRAALAVYMKRARDWSNFTPSSPTFADVPGNHWARGAIERIYQKGIVSGCSSNPKKYCPADDISRAAAARLIARSYGLIDF